MKKTSFLFSFMLTVLSINGFAADYGKYHITVSHEYIGIDAKHLIKATSTSNVEFKGDKEYSFPASTTDTYNSNDNTMSGKPYTTTISNKYKQFRTRTCATQAYGKLGDDFVWGAESYTIANSYLELKPCKIDYYNVNTYKKTEANWYATGVLGFPLTCSVE